MKPRKALTFMDSPGNQRRVRKYFYIALLLLLVVDLFISKQVHFAWEAVPAFYAIYGFIACVGLIFLARLLRLLVKRKEDYYD